MYSASDIAFYFLSKSIKDNSPVSNLKLQKLVYLACGFYGALAEKPLIDERIEAWPYGPVIRSLYFKYRDYGNKDIIMMDETFPKLPEFDEKATKALNFTWTVGKDLDAIRLSNWTHIEGSPWKTTVDKGDEVIPDALIFEYFKKFLKSQANEQVQANA